MDGITANSARRGWLINRNFTALCIGQGISNVGDALFDTTLILWIATKLAVGTSWAPLAVSGVLVATFGPVMVLGPVAGVFVDRWNKRTTMMVTDLARAACILALLGSTWLIPDAVDGSSTRTFLLGATYATVVLVTIFSLFFGPSRMTVIGDVVPASEQTRAAGLSQMLRHLAMIIGPPLAGPLYFAAGARWALAVNALSFLISFLAIWAVHTTEPPRAHGATEGPRFWSELTAGLHFFAGSRVLTTLLIAAVLIMLGGGALNALDIFFVTQNLHAPANLFGLLSGAMGIGAVAGAALASGFTHRIGPARLFWTSVLATGVAMTAYSRTSSFIPGIVLIFIAGIPMAALNVAIMPLILQVTPREMIGRVGAVLDPVVSLASLVSIVVAGWLAGTVLRNFHARVLGLQLGAVDSIFMVAGLLAVAAGLYAAINLRGVDASQQSGEIDTSPRGKQVETLEVSA